MMLLAHVLVAESPGADIAFVGEIIFIVGLLMAGAVVDVVLIPIVGDKVALAGVAVRHFMVWVAGFIFLFF